MPILTDTDIEQLENQQNKPILTDEDVDTISSKQFLTDNDIRQFETTKKQYKPLIRFVNPEEHPILETVQEAGAAGGKFLSTLGLGLPEYALKKFTGYEIPIPPSKAGKVLSAGAELGGFIKSAIPLAGKIATKIPLVAKAFKPAASITQAVAKPIIRGAATLGIASALQAPETTEKGLLAPQERIKQFVSGAKTGAAFGGISFIPNKALRMITSSAFTGVPSTLRNEPLEQQIFQYGLGAWFGRTGGTPRQILAREKPLTLLIKDGTDKPEQFLNNARKIIQQEKDEALKTGIEPISRQEKFNRLVEQEATSGLLTLAQQTITEGMSKQWKNQVARNIRKRVIELKRDPYFQLEIGEADIIVDYITKDLRFKTSELTKLDRGQLLYLNDFLREYRPPADSPFLKQPPSKPIFAGRDWRRKINPWDITLRGGLYKLQKLGFGTPYEEGLTGKFLSSAADKARFMDRYIKLRNNWKKITGFNKQRSNDIFDYLDGNLNENYLKKIQGEKTLQVANQMREFLDTLLVHTNRQRAIYGEQPVKPLRNYITHIFEDTVKEIQNKKYPFPDWLTEAMPYIFPQKKISPYLRERKGASGYQKDIWRALDAYTYRTAQVIGDEPIRRAYKVNRFIDKQIDSERQSGKVSEIDWSGIKKNLKDYVEDLQGRPGKLDQTLRGLIDPLNSVLEKLPGQPQIKSLNDISDGMVSLIYGSQMAFRPKLPIRNLGQHSLIIGQTGFKPLGWAIKNRNTPEAKQILSNSKILASRRESFGAETQALSGTQLIQKISKIGLEPFRKSDLWNAEDAFLSGYKWAKNQEKSDVEAYKIGDKVAGLTQFIYLPENRSDLARAWGLSKTFGRALSVFTTWPANFIEFNIASASSEETRKNLLKYWAASLTLTGLAATIGIKGAEYTGVTAPMDLIKLIGRGDIPLLSILKRPRFQALKEWQDFVEGDKDLKDILFYTSW